MFVSTTTSFLISLFISILKLGFHDKLAMIYTTSEAVINAVDHISVLLAFTIILNGVQPVLSGMMSPDTSGVSIFFSSVFSFLSCFPWTDAQYLLVSTTAGVAIGSGWQALVAYVNIGSYYLIGVPFGVLLGWGFRYGVYVCLVREHTKPKNTVFICDPSFIRSHFAGNLDWNDRWHNDTNSNFGVHHHTMRLG